MEKILHSAAAKWIAGILMMVFLSLGVYFGIQVLAAVESGGIEVLSGAVSEGYEESQICAGDLAMCVKSDIACHIAAQISKEQCKDTKGTAMTVWPFELWLASLTGNAGPDALQQLEQDATGGEDNDSSVADTKEEIQEYSYDMLLELREVRNLSDGDDSNDSFFDNDSDIEDHIYVAVSPDQLIEVIKQNASVQYHVSDTGEISYDEEEYLYGDEGMETSQYKYYQYEADVDSNLWTYNEATKEISCSRFGTLKSDKTLYFSKVVLDKYAMSYTVDQPSGSVADSLLQAPISYFDVLIQHYTRELNRDKENQKTLEQMLSQSVNYRYQVVLQDGTVWTNVPDIADIQSDASVYWNYDCSSENITGTMSKECGDYLYDKLIDDYFYLDDDRVVFSEYLEENVNRVSIALPENMEYNDMIKRSKSVYEEYKYLYKNAKRNLTAGCICMIVFLILFVYLLLVVGYENSSGKLTRPSITFRIPTELILAVSWGLLIIFFVLMNEGFDNEIIQVFGGKINYASAMCIGVCWSALPFGFELLVRIRHRQFLKKSICYRFTKFLLEKPLAWCRKKRENLSTLWSDLCGAMKIDTRLCLKFLISQIALFFLVVFTVVCIGDCGLLFLLLALVLEAIVIMVVFRDIRYTAQIIQGVEALKGGNLDYQIPAEHMKGHKKELAQSINHLQNGLKLAVEQSIKDERLKTELITNVSHDIKTPLTSIINYVDLLKQEPMEGEHAKHYLEVLDQKSQRLKQLMEDLVEVSKSATGNIDFTPMRLDLIELLRQILGEFEDKFSSRNLTVVENFKLETAVVNLDSKHTFRVFENLCQNIYKYAMENSRIYVDVTREDTSVQIVMKNISQYALNISADELMERFVRGDESRNTSGSGLGLSIAKNLVTLQQGAFYITLDGDLFKVTVTFPLAAGIEPDAVMDVVE